MKKVEAEEVKAWIIKNQFGRRNLSNYQRSELALKLEGLYKEKAKENMKKAEGGDRKSERVKENQGLSNSTKVDKPINTREELAKKQVYLLILSNVSIIP